MSTVDLAPRLPALGLLTVVLFGLGIGGSSAALATPSLVHLVDGPLASGNSIAVSARPGGGFSLAWVTEESSIQRTLHVRRFDARGEPSGPVIDITTSTVFEVDLSSDRMGNDLVVYRLITGLPRAWDHWRAAVIDGEGVIRENFRLTPGTGIGTPNSSWPFIEPSPAGGWVASWFEHPNYPPEDRRLLSRRIFVSQDPGEPVRIIEGGLDEIRGFELVSSSSRLYAFWFRRATLPSLHFVLEALELSPEGLPTGAPAPVGVEETNFNAGPLLGAAISGEKLLLTWAGAENPDGFLELRGVRVNGRSALGEPFTIRDPEQEPFANLRSLALAVDASGRSIVTWAERKLDTDPLRTFALRFAASSGAPLAERVVVNELSAPVSGIPDVALIKEDTWMLAWPQAGDADSSPGIDVWIAAAEDECKASQHALCLSGNRFRARASYHDHLGRRGEGIPVSLTDESGSFWFFSDQSLELFVKIVDACGHPDFHDFWVFASGLTDVEVELEVVDLWSGERWSRSTALGEPFPSVLDTRAFDTCTARPAEVGVN